MRGLADSTLRIRLELLHRLHQHADVPLRDIEPRHLLTFERVAIAGRTAETRRAYTSHLRSFYRWAHRTGVVEFDPTEVLTMPVVPRHLPRPVSEHDLAVALAAARPKMRALITLAAYAGLRTCEISGLDWADVQREPGGSAFIHVRNGKGNRERTVEVGETVTKALQAYGIKRRGIVFYGRDGAQITAKGVSSSVNRYLATHDIPATAHQLRHRFATIAYQLTHDLLMVSKQLGHASSRTTEGYARPTADAARRMVLLMDALALPQPRRDRDPVAAPAH